MYKISSIKKSIICAICIALCYVLPLAFHAIGSGSVFCPIHIPVLICGLICGWQYGILCGLAGPAISCVMTNMPTVANLPPMCIELVVYGIVTGLMFKLIRTKNTYADLYISLCTAIVIGRIVGGAAKALIFATGTYSMATWVSAYVVTSWPGTLIQLIFIPTIVFSLMKAHLIPERYPKVSITEDENGEEEDNV